MVLGRFENSLHNLFNYLLTLHNAGKFGFGPVTHRDAAVPLV
jgi:hypothetical protein